MHINLADQYLPRGSIVHQMDPRVKVLVVVFFIISLGLLPEGEWTGFLLHFLLLTMIIKVSAVPFGSIVRRSLVGFPFIIASVTVLFTTSGVAWFNLPVVGWTITETGAIRFLSITLRVWLAVQSAILLTVTTRVPDLFWTFTALKMPPLLVATISFMYRYTFVLADEALRMMRARSARSPRLPDTPKPSIFWEGRVSGSMVGSLFIRSLERSERVYAAMLSRGYDGRVLVMSRFKMRQIDWVILFGHLTLIVSTQILIHFR